MFLLHEIVDCALGVLVVEMPTSVRQLIASFAKPPPLFQGEIVCRIPTSDREAEHDSPVAWIEVRSCGNELLVRTRRENKTVRDVLDRGDAVEFTRLSSLSRLSGIILFSDDIVFCPEKQLAVSLASRWQIRLEHVGLDRIVARRTQTVVPTSSCAHSIIRDVITGVCYTLSWGRLTVYKFDPETCTNSLPAILSLPFKTSAHAACVNGVLYTVSFPGNDDVATEHPWNERKFIAVRSSELYVLDDLDVGEITTVANLISQIIDAKTIRLSLWFHRLGSASQWLAEIDIDSATGMPRNTTIAAPPEKRGDLKFTTLLFSPRICERTQLTPPGFVNPETSVIMNGQPTIVFNGTRELLFAV
jgi:hypothetical protein